MPDEPRPPCPHWLHDILGNPNYAENAWRGMLDHGTITDAPEAPTDWQKFAEEYLADAREGTTRRTRARLAELEAHALGARVLMIPLDP